MDNISNEHTAIPTRRLGRMPAKASRKALMFSDFAKYLALPEATNFWSRRTALPLRTFGNDQYGDCTRAKQAVAAMRMERLEQKRTIQILDEEIIRVYIEMSNRRYGGGDNGAYEDDALTDWRNIDTTFRDTKGNAYTIDAFLRLNPFDHEEVRLAIAMSGARGIPVCISLPAAFQGLEPPAAWDIPEGQVPVGRWMPGSWGGHSMWAHDYTAEGIWLDHTWKLRPQLLTWRAASVYLDEAHVVIDSVDSWRKAQKLSRAGKLDMKAVVEAVNDVSSIKIK